MDLCIYFCLFTDPNNSGSGEQVESYSPRKPGMGNFFGARGGRGNYGNNRPPRGGRGMRGFPPGGGFRARGSPRGGRGPSRGGFN